MKPSRVLFVDDDEFIRKIYIDRLQASEFEVVPASSGKEAKSLLEKETFDLICLDYMLSDLNGIEILHWIRDEKHIITPVIAFSASGNEAKQQEFMAAGASEFVQKDHVVPSELVEKIKKLIKKNNE